MGKNLLEILIGAKDEDVPMIIFGYGKENELNLFLDYVRTSIYAGNVDKKFVDHATQGLSDELPNGFGFRIEGSDKVDDMGIFCMAVISSAKSEYNKIQKDLDINNPDDEEAFIEAQKKLSMLAGYALIIKEQCKVGGNNLKRDLAIHKKNIRVVGDEKGNVQIFVNRFEITKDNPGECVISCGNACNEAFDITGQIRGFQGVAQNISDQHFVSFYFEDGDLFLQESWFKGGKPELKGKEHGRLIK